jgi:hypothetical protein
MGILFEPRCYTEQGMITRLGELCANNAKFLHAFCSAL